MSTPDDAHINQLLDEILALPAHKRARYLKEHCKDLAMRTKIQILIDNCETEVPDSFLQPTPQHANWVKMAYQKLKAGASKKRRSNDDS